MVKVFKNIKRLKLKIASMVMLVVLLTLELSPLSVKGAAQQLQFYAPHAVSVGYDSMNGKNVWYARATLGGSTAYCIDYTCGLPSGTMNFRQYLSDQGLAILLNGFPNCSAASLGCASDDEAYMATQMALWEVMNRTGESEKAGKIFRVNEVEPVAGKKEFYERAVAAAAKLRDIAIANPYTDSPVMTIDNSRITDNYSNGVATFGPYQVTVSGVADAGCIKSITATLVDAPASAYVADANGNRVTNLSNGQEVYVKMNTSENDCSFKIRFHSDVDRKVGCIYRDSDGGYVQDYVMIDTEPNSMERDLGIEFKKTSTIGEIKLVKVDQEDEPVEGAKFTLKTADGKEIITDTTDANGELKFIKVPEGQYILEEVEAPEGYTITEKSKNVTVVRGQTAEVKFVNERITGKLVITKINDLNKPLKDVTFNIYDKDKHYVTEVVTDANGKASVTLPYGEYYFKEESAPEGVKIDETIYHFNVTAENRTFYQTVTNVTYKGTIVIVKVDDSTPAQPLQGVKFEITEEDGTLVKEITTNAKGQCGLTNLPYGKYYYQETYVPEGYEIDTNKYEFKIETDGQVIRKDVVNHKETIKGHLEIYKEDDKGNKLQGVEFDVLDSDKKVVDHITTNGDGFARTKDLPLGTYYYKETKAPKDVIMDQDEHEFKMDEDNRIVVETVINKIQEYGKLKIFKEDDKGNKLKGVEFDVLDESKKVVDHITTDGDGYAETKDLPIGQKYYYKETKAPAGVIMDQDEHEFSFTSENKIVVETVINKTVEVITGHLIINKIDTNNEPIKGVEFDILAADKKTVVDHIVTDEKGYAKTVELEIGTYYFKEVKAPENVVMDIEPHGFVLTEATKEVTKTVINDLTGTHLKIIKVDENNKALEGVKFNVYDENKKLIDTMVTDKEGIAQGSAELDKGKTYYYQEVEAPKGIKVDKKMYEFTVERDGENVIKNMVNYYIKGKLVIHKLVTGTKNPLKDVKFYVLDADKNIIDTIVTDENGYAESKELLMGTYYFQEVEAPQGYIKDTTEYDFEIIEDGDVVEAVVYNAEETLPKTGGLVSGNMMIILIVTLVGMVGYGIMRVTAKKED